TAPLRYSLRQRAVATGRAAAFERDIGERQHVALKPLDVTRPATTRNEGGGGFDSAPPPPGFLRLRFVQEHKRELAEIPGEPDAITELEGQIESFVQESSG